MTLDVYILTYCLWTSMADRHRSDELQSSKLKPEHLSIWN